MNRLNNKSFKELETDAGLSHSILIIYIKELNKMKKTEIILLLLFLIALILESFHVQGSNILLFVSLLLISFLYFYLGFALFNNIRFKNIFKKKSYKNISSKRIIGATGTGFNLSIATIGILFKFLLWPGGNLLLMIATFGLSIITLISIIKIPKTKDKYYSKILKRVVIFGTLSLFLFLLPKETWLNWKHPNNPEYVKAIIDYEANPKNQELQKKRNEERDKMLDELYKK